MQSRNNRGKKNMLRRRETRQRERQRGLPVRGKQYSVRERNKTSQGANYRESVVHSQRVSPRWWCADSLKDCRSFRHGEWEKIDGSKVFQICTLQCGSALQSK